MSSNIKVTSTQISNTHHNQESPKKLYVIDLCENF